MAFVRRELVSRVRELDPWISVIFGRTFVEMKRHLKTTEWVDGVDEREEWGEA